MQSQPITEQVKPARDARRTKPDTRAERSLDDGAIPEGRPVERPRVAADAPVLPGQYGAGF